ncbi:MAG: hypothetical protein MJ211_10425 [Bacteroidales bacterium]|nr:hypothetical protein [Bacteroidales bacterium]
MKKYIYIVSMILAMSFISCEKEEIGGTATQKVAGEWYVSFDAIDNNGEVITSEEFVELGELDNAKGIIRTFNTSANVPNKMQISDMATFGSGVSGISNIWPFFCFNVEIDIDQTSGNFNTANNDFVTNIEDNYQWEEGDPDYPQHSQIKIVNGKISYDGATQNNGSVDDAIEFDIFFKDDYASVTGYWDYYYGVTIEHYHVKGIRYSGLVENN